MIKTSEISTIIHARILGSIPDDFVVNKLVIDSRSLIVGGKDVFIAFLGHIHDGHDFLEEIFDRGIRHFIVSKVPEKILEGATYWLVGNTVSALQLLAKEKLNRSNLKEIVAITGSNGKTVVKEWLTQILQSKYHVVKSPKSYNSQIGVPLSAWEVNDNHEIAIFEAGISQVGEMDNLFDILQPSIGIFTHLGDAHNQGFFNKEEKIREKIRLYQSCKVIILDNEERDVVRILKKTYPDKEIINWHSGIEYGSFSIKNIGIGEKNTSISISKNRSLHHVILSFIEKSSVQNAINCIVCSLYLGMDIDRLEDGLSNLQRLQFRLEVQEGLYDSVIINDTYNADITSLEYALKFMNQQGDSSEKMVFITEFDELGMKEDEVVKKIADLLNKSGISICVAVGKSLEKLEKYFLGKYIFFSNVDSLIKGFDMQLIYQRTILVKSARRFKMERWVDRLSKAFHSATLEVDLDIISNNLSYYASKLGSDTKIMGVIKASGYGSGASVVAKLLEYRKLEYLAVANIDEGIQLRNTNIQLPILILNPGLGNIPQLTKYRLEPEIYGFEQLEEIKHFSQHIESPLGIHIKIDTGMHRLGFLSSDVDELISQLTNLEKVKVKSIFTHLAASDDQRHDEYSLEQLHIFDTIFKKFCDSLGYYPLKHALNTSGIQRFPQYKFDMVRIGLGLYGVNEELVAKNKLVLAHELTASVIQTKNLKKGDTIGYGRKGIMQKDGRIAIVNIGYADGLMRNSGDGKYEFMIRGHKAQIIGNICMDSTMIDISNIESVNIGSRVTIFGKEGGIFKLAKINNTIPYEIISRISSRVKRIYAE